MSLSDPIVTALLLLAYLGTHILCLGLGFIAGRATLQPPEPAPEKEKRGKEQPPYVESVKDDPWNDAMTEEIPQDKKKPKIVGGM